MSKITKMEKLMLTCYMIAMAFVGISFIPMPVIIEFATLVVGVVLLGISGSYFIWKTANSP